MRERGRELGREEGRAEEKARKSKRYTYGPVEKEGGRHRKRKKERERGREAHCLNSLAVHLVMFVWSGEEEASVSLLVDQEIGKVYLKGEGGRKKEAGVERRKRGQQCWREITRGREK